MKPKQRSIVPTGAVLAIALLSSNVACEVIPECQGDADCEAPAFCNPDGACETPPLLADAEPCTLDVECESGSCLNTADGALCGRACLDQDDCGEGLSCGLALIVDTALEALIQICAHDGAGGRPPGAVCLLDEDCATRLCHEHLCAEICQTCGEDALCAPVRVERFDRAVDVSICQAQPGLEVVELGGIATPDAGSSEISFDVPAGTAAFTLVLHDQDGLRVAVRSLTAPDGTSLIDIDDEEADLNPGFNYPGAIAVLVPGTDAPEAEPQTGTYRLRVGTFDPANWEALVPAAGELERVAVLLEREGEQGGLLDLHLHFATDTGLHAAEAPSSDFVTAMLNTIEAFYRDVAGLRLGVVEFSDLPPEHAVVEEGDELRQICSTYSQPGPHGLSVNMFLIDDLSFTTGFSGGIPGPPDLFGTEASGIVQEAMGSGTHTGVFLGHELGHFLGLRHTTETSGGRVDPILDTPVCESGTSVEQCPDFGNLMFPYIPSSTDLSLSPGQVKVLRGNPSLYELSRPQACPGTRVYDLTEARFGSGRTDALVSQLQGSCGGASAPERVDLYRLTSTDLAALEVQVTGLDFAPAVYALFGGCDVEAVELGCATAEAEEPALLRVEQPEPGPYFIVVDGRDGVGGDYVLEIVEEMPEP